MAAQNVIICKNLQSELQNFLQSVKYDKLFVLTDSNTLELCLPMLKEVPQLQGAPVITVEAGDTNKNIEQVTAIWMRLCNEGASRNSLLLNV
ncbi:MAG: 3-dehydroquinate synthase, partial [Parabacteroides sp.]|nr:3-dehydroquinate synthase [Parabacteroides sp.]